MILGVDAWRAAEPRMGVGRHMQHVLEAWTEQELPFEAVRVFSPRPLDDLELDDRFSQEVLPSRGPGIWWQNARLRPRLRGVDVLFAPYVLPPGYRGRSVVLNCAIYEGEYAETFPDWRSRARSLHFAHSARHADAVIAISQSTKLDLIRHYEVPAERVSVIWPGVDPLFRPAAPGDETAISDTVERVLGGNFPYFLFVGKFSLRRNIPALLEAFAQVSADHPEFRLLFVGQDTGNVGLPDHVSRLGLGGKVRQVDHLDHPTLALLYRGARAFVLPTAHEGFSATLNEALASGTPALVCDHRTLSERGLREAVHVVPDAAASTLADALARLARNDELCSELARRGPRCTAQFSWSECARSTADLLSKVAAADGQRNGGARHRHREPATGAP